MGAAAQHPRRRARVAARTICRLPGRCVDGRRRACGRGRGLRRAGRSRGAVRRAQPRAHRCQAASLRCWCPRSCGVRSPAVACARSLARRRTAASSSRTGPRRRARSTPRCIRPCSSLRAPRDGQRTSCTPRCGAGRSRSRGARSRRRSGSTSATRRVPWLLLPPEVRAAFDRHRARTGARSETAHSVDRRSA